jgi:hypothetical protein
MSQLINEIKQDLHGVKNPKSKKEEKKSMTLMEMVFNNDMNPQEIDNPGYDTNAGINEPNSMPQQTAGDEQPIQKNIDGMQQVDPEIKKMLSEIRFAVIKGLQKLANNPENQYYDCLKKILTIIDKPIETENKVKGIG